VPSLSERLLFPWVSHSDARVQAPSMMIRRCWRDKLQLIIGIISDSLSASHRRPNSTPACGRSAVVTAALVAQISNSDAWIQAPSDDDAQRADVVPQSCRQLPRGLPVQVCVCLQVGSHRLQLRWCEFCGWKQYSTISARSSMVFF
jgi:hypothetical protein